MLWVRGGVRVRPWKTAGKWRKCDPIEHRLRSSRHGWTMNLVDWLRTSSDERVLSGRCAVVICVMGCLRGLVVLYWPFVSREQSLWPFSGPGLDSCVLAYCGSAAPVEECWCCRTWVQWSPCIGGAKCGLIASNERDVQSFPEVGLQRLLARSLPRCRSRRACVCLYIHFVCVCVYMSWYACMYADMYIFIKMLRICTSMRLCTCVCVCVCIFVHRLWVLVSVFQRVDCVMHAHVFSCTCVCVCICDFDFSCFYYWKQ